MFCLERVLLSFAFLPDTIDCFIPVNGEKATTLFFSKVRDRARTLLVDGDAGNHGLLCLEVFVQNEKNKRTKRCSAIFALRFFSYWTFMRDLIFLVHDWGFMDGNITSPDAFMMLCDFAPTLFLHNFLCPWKSMALVAGHGRF